mmetsp:Transcript_3309/g.6866  ORF Transcript_3309/g.6866 Transcript_3309/m.6866 type:complete len:110 (+) Transcript_3309:266-595(+)
MTCLKIGPKTFSWDGRGGVAQGKIIPKCTFDNFKLMNHHYFEFTSCAQQYYPASVRLLRRFIAENYDAAKRIVPKVHQIFTSSTMGRAQRPFYNERNFIVRQIAFHIRH